MIHSVWTLMTPFIGGICNCDLNGTALRAAHKDFPVMFKAEYTAEIDNLLCTGCEACSGSCHFEALSFDLTNKKAVIDPARCYGCGICRAFCRQDAIALRERPAVEEIIK